MLILIDDVRRRMPFNNITEYAILRTGHFLATYSRTHSSAEKPSNLFARLARSNSRADSLLRYRIIWGLMSSELDNATTVLSSRLDTGRRTCNSAPTIGPLGR